MSRLPPKGWKTARRALGLGLLGTCLAGARPAIAGSVPFAPSAAPTDSQPPAPPADDLDSSFARAIGLARSEDRSSANHAALDPIAALAHFSTAESALRRAPIIEVAPADPFVLSAMGKPKEPVKSIPNLPALWSGMTGLAGLGAFACIRRVRRVLR